MAYPSDLIRTKNWGNETLTDTDLEGQLDLIIDWVMASANATTGHSHDATSNEGPNIILTSGATQGVTGTLPDDNGGTGQSTYTQGDILIASATDTLAKLAKGTDNQQLKMTSTVPEWSSLLNATSTIYTEASAPSTAANEGAVYVKNDGAQTELYFREESDGDEVQITDNGAVNSATPGLTLISTTTGTAANSGEITIAPSKRYFVTVECDAPSADIQLAIRFNNSATSTGYAYTCQTMDFATSPTVANTGDDSADRINITSSGDAIDATGGWYRGQFWIDTNKQGNYSAFINGQASYLGASGSLRKIDFAGSRIASLTIDSFEVLHTSTSWTYAINLYELA